MKCIYHAKVLELLPFFDRQQILVKLDYWLKKEKKEEGVVQVWNIKHCWQFDEVLLSIMLNDL